MRKTVIGPDVGSDLELFEGVEGVEGLPHSEAVAVDLPGYRRVFISGTAAIDGAGDVVAPGDAPAQLEHVYGTLSELLGAVGGGFEDLVRLRLITEPLTDEEYLDVVRVRQRYLEAGHEPASTVIEAADVGVEGMRLEVDADAVIPEDSWTVTSTER